MATIVGFISEKGGTGKTTTCFHIAVALQRFHQKRILVVDADYQLGGITGRFFPDLIEQFGHGEMSGTTLFHKFQQLYSAGQQSPTVDVRSWRNIIDVIVADPRLSTVTTDKLPSTNNIRQNNQSLLRHLQVIDFVLTPLGSKYDFVLIDSHPEVSDILRSIIYACDHIVSPTKLDRQSTIGVATVLGELKNVNSDVKMIQNSLNNDLIYKETNFAGSIGTMAREWGGKLKRSEEIQFNELRRAGGVFENYVTEGDGLRQAAQYRTSVFKIFIANAYKQADQYKKLTREFLKVCK